MKADIALTTDTGRFSVALQRSKAKRNYRARGRRARRPGPWSFRSVDTPSIRAVLRAVVTNPFTTMTKVYLKVFFFSLNFAALLGICYLLLSDRSIKDMVE